MLGKYCCSFVQPCLDESFVLKLCDNACSGIFTPRAEITNARAAMLGFAVLLLLEQKSAVPFF